MPDVDILRSTLESWLRSLTDAGAGYGAALDLLYLLLALKLDDELAGPPHHQPHTAPEGARWSDLRGRSGQELTATLQSVVEQLATLPTTLGQLARGVVAVGTPARVADLIARVDDPHSHVGMPWQAARRTHLAPAIDRLLIDAAADDEANVLFVPTPRPVATTIAQVLAPQPTETFADPAVGSGGLLIALAGRASSGVSNRTALTHLRDQAFSAGELRPDTTRWGTFNLLLHGIGTLAGDPIVENRDSLAQAPATKTDVLVTNPQFGRADKAFASSLTDASRDDINITGNRQLDMVQHAIVSLDSGGRAAMIVPDNVLFEAGAGERIRRQLLDTCDLHTILRLPTGLTHKGSVKMNVLFFTRHPARAEPWTRHVWIYDLRTNQHFTFRQNPLTSVDLQPFVDAYKADDPGSRTETERFRCFSYDDVVAREHANLDVTWLTDDSHVSPDQLPDPATLAREIADDLLDAHETFEALADELEERTA